MFDRKPCVFLVGQTYQIIFNTLERGIAWVEVGGAQYPDEKGGLMRSETTVHRAVVPCAALDESREYTVCFRALPERRPYYPELGPEEREVYPFRPVDWSDGAQLMMIGDTHSCVEEGIATGRHFGDKLDLLVMNGDIPAESKTERDVLAVFDIAGGVTGGERPVLFIRGNHDTRGKFAVEFLDFIGTDQGNTYFTFRTGSLWGIVLDCGEDKWDDSVEYGGIVRCAPFRRRQREFLRRVLAEKEKEFAAPGVRTRLAFCHVPFMTDLMGLDKKFDIEQELYAEWTALLNGMGIDLMLCAHHHQLATYPAGDAGLRYGAAFPVIVGTEPHFPSSPDFRPSLGTAVTIDEGGIHAVFADGRGRTLPAMELSRRK